MIGPMNDNAPESERWVPVPAEQNAKSAYCSPALDRARREAEAVIAKAFPSSSLASGSRPDELP